MLMGSHKTQRIAWAIELFLKWYHIDDVEFLIHIVPNDETWSSVVDVETKEQSKNTHTFTNSQKSLKELYLPENWMQLYFLGKERMLTAEAMQQDTTITL
jgi:hypothetical protein